MADIVIKMLLCLIIAAIIGAVIGYLIGRLLKCDCKEQKDEDDRFSDFKITEIEDDKPAMLTASTEEIEANVVDDEVLQSIVKQESGLSVSSDEDKPELLDAPRGGKADDLKEISGIGVKIEETLNELGVYHFDQIANWTKANVDWVNEHLLVFKGRIEREKWVEQAKKLARGEQTEFSKRVKNGEIDRY